MKGRFKDGKGEKSLKNGGKLNNEIKVTRRKFVKTTAAFGAAVAGIPPFNLTDIADIVLKDDGELIMSLWKQTYPIPINKAIYYFYPFFR